MVSNFGFSDRHFVCCIISPCVLHVPRISLQVFPWKVVTHLVKKLPVVYFWALRFISIFTRVRHWTVSWGRQLALISQIIPFNKIIVMKQSRHWSINSTPFMEPNVSLSYSREPTASPILCQFNPVNFLTHCFFKVHLSMIIPCLSQVVSYLQVFQINFVSSFRFVLHTPPISSSVVWSC